MVTVTAHVEVGLDEFSDNDLVNEVEKRGLYAESDHVELAFKAALEFNLGKTQMALTTTRELIESITGQQIFGDMK